MNYDDLSDWTTYVPKWNDNREAKDPITVEIHPICMEDSEKYALLINKMQREKLDDAEINLKVGKQQLMECCRNIQGLKFGGRAITTPEELWKTPYADLIQELGIAIRDISYLLEGEIKNFRSQSDGSSKESDGTAENVESKSLMNAETARVSDTINSARTSEG